MTTAEIAADTAYLATLSTDRLAFTAAEAMRRYDEANRHDGYSIGDADAAKQLAQIARRVEQRTATRTAADASWAAVGVLYGITGRAAQQRFGCACTTDSTGLA